MTQLVALLRAWLLAQIKLGKTVSQLRLQLAQALEAVEDLLTEEDNS